MLLYLFVCLSAPLFVFVCVALHMLIGTKPSSYRRAFKFAKAKRQNSKLFTFAAELGHKSNMCLNLARFISFLRRTCFLKRKITF